MTIDLTNGQSGHDNTTPPSPPSSTVSPNLTSTIHAHLKSITCLAFSPCGTLLALGSSSSHISLHSLPSLTHLHTITTSHTSGINDLTFSCDSLYLASSSDDLTIKIHSLLTFSPIRTFADHTSYVLCLAYNPTSTLLVSGSFDETVRLWNVSRSKCHRVISAHSEAVTGVCFSGDGTMIASCSYDATLRLWDTTSGACLKTLVHKDQSPLGGVVFSPNSAHLLATSLDSSIRMWDVYNDKIVKTYTGHLNTKIPITAKLAHFHPKTPQSAEEAEEAAVITAGEDGKVTLWDVQSKKIACQWSAHKDTVVAVALHPTQRIVATATVEPECSVKLWHFPHTTS
ncbi:COMPASS component SWD3 [Pseudozyma hubeiensis]|nr:COMPASS component SWD3 [Pseudozyma hubeiensis]